MSFRLTIAFLFGGAVVVFALVLYSFDNYAGKVALASALLGALAVLLFPRSLFKGESEPAPSIHLSSTGFEVRRGVASLPASALLEATMESIREGVLVVDGGARVLGSNNAARALFGEVATAASGERRLSELTRDPSIHAAFAAALERGERAEAKVEMGDSERRVFDLHVAPLKNKAGAGVSPPEARGAVGVFFDITRLERLERVRQEFLSNVSHELRTPLTAILAFVETLEEGAIDDPEHNRRFLSIIRRNSERMHNLINDILELSAIEAGMVEVEAATVRLSSLVNDCLTALASRASERGVTSAQRSAGGGHGARRRAAARTDVDEPPRQRHQVQRRGRRSPRLARARDRARPRPRLGRGRRHRARTRRAHLRALLPR